jgi:hypothetical protein
MILPNFRNQLLSLIPFWRATLALVLKFSVLFQIENINSSLHVPFDWMEVMFVAATGHPSGEDKPYIGPHASLLHHQFVSKSERGCLSLPQPLLSKQWFLVVNGTCDVWALLVPTLTAYVQISDPFPIENSPWSRIMEVLEFQIWWSAPCWAVWVAWGRLEYMPIALGEVVMNDWWQAGALQDLKHGHAQSDARLWIIVWCCLSANSESSDPVLPFTWTICGGQISKLITMAQAMYQGTRWCGCGSMLKLITYITRFPTGVKHQSSSELISRNHS